jgi:hypothetical protein
MNRGLKFGIACLIFSTALGCIPEKRIAWSPDGQRAAIMAEGGLYFIDGDGKLLPPRLAASSAHCEWFPDNQRLLVKYSVSTSKWSDVMPLFSEKEALRIRDEAKTVRERMLAYEGDWAKFELDPSNRFAPGSEVAILLCLRDEFSEGLRDKLGPQWEDSEKIKADIINLQIFTLTNTELQAGPTLLRTLNPLAAMRISPDGKNVAVVMPAPEGTDHPQSLFLLPVTGGPARSVAPNVAVNFDWSPDARSLAFIRSDSPSHEGADNVQLGMLTTVSVIDENGALLEQWADQKDRIGLLFNDRLMVRWLSDGRLFFSSVEVTLPATTRDMPQRWSVFAFDPRMPAGIVRVLGRDFEAPLDTGLPMFFLSPDEKRLLLPGPKGALTLYEIATSTSTPITGPDERDDKLRSLPSWRNNTEICFVGAGSTEGKVAPEPQVLLWKDGKATTLSDSWPPEAKQGWIIPADK